MKGLRQNMHCRRMIADERGASTYVLSALNLIQCLRLARPCAQTCVINGCYRPCDVPATVRRHSRTERLKPT